MVVIGEHDLAIEVLRIGPQCGCRERRSSIGDVYGACIKSQVAGIGKQGEFPGSSAQA